MHAASPSLPCERDERRLVRAKCFNAEATSPQVIGAKPFLVEEPRLLWMRGIVSATLVVVQ